jgi:general secretion pathway protein G
MAPVLGIGAAQAQAAPPAACARKLTADVAALDQAVQFSRYDSHYRAFMIYALRHGVVPKSGTGTLTPGNVGLHDDHQSRSVVLRMDVGDCGAFVGRSASSLVAPGGSATYRLHASVGGTLLFYNQVVTNSGEADTGSFAFGMFGVVTAHRVAAAAPAGRQAARRRGGRPAVPGGSGGPDVARPSPRRHRAGNPSMKRKHPARGLFGQTRRPGFTLVELLVVLVILGLLAAVAAPQAMRYIGGAKQDAAKLQLQGLATAIDLYRLDIGRYPSREEGLAALVQKPAGLERWNGPYVRKAEQLQDPWGRVWRYRMPGEHGTYDLFSFGADDRPSGTGEDRDVTSW